MRKCCVLNRRFLFILFKQVVINHSISALICFSSHISFSFTMVFRTLPCFSRFGKNLFDFLFFRTIGIYFELEYLQVCHQKFHLRPAYAYCAILYFLHYEFLFPELLSYLLNYWSFCFFSLLKWFREGYAEFANLIFEKIENLFCLFSFKLLKIYIFLSSLRKLSFCEIDLLNTHRSKPRPSSLDKDVLIAIDEWSLMKLTQLLQLILANYLR